MAFLFHRQERSRTVGTWAFGVLALLWLAAVASSNQTMEAAAQAPVSSAAAGASGASSADADAQRALIKQYCVTCHNTQQKSRNATTLALNELDVTDVAAHAEDWEKVIAKLRAGLMPPAGMPRPDKASLDGLSAWLETQIDRVAAARPNPGRTEALHRLNRAEYQNAIRDLLHLDLDVSALLPADDVSAGFDNVASTLTVSPTLIDRYLAVAQKVSRLAVGTPLMVPNVDYFRLADDLRQDDHLPGLPFGTRGGTRIRYTFPLDGDYIIKVRLARDMNEQMPPYPDAQQLEVTLDGKRLQMFTLPATTRLTGRGGGGGVPAAAASPAAPAAAPAAPASAGRGAANAAAPVAAAAEGDEPQSRRPGAAQAAEAVRLPATARESRNRADQEWDVRVTVTAGEHDVTAAFLRKTSAVDETARLPFLRPYPAGNNVPETRMGAALRSVEISGPHGAAAAGDTRSRRRIFVCHPNAAARAQVNASGSASADECATSILSTLARRAYRRPVTDTDMQPLLALYQDGRAQGGFEGGIERALRRLLVSPEFLYRVEVDPASARAGVAYAVSDLELASRLSFFVWSSIPDDELLAAAEKGELRTPAILAQQVQADAGRSAR